MGPDSEVQLWKSRLAKVSYLKLQLKGREAKSTLGVANATRSEASKSWREVELKASVLSNSKTSQTVMAPGHKPKNVDLRGFDPRTSSLLTRRTTDCSTNPTMAQPAFRRPI